MREVVSIAKKGSCALFALHGDTSSIAELARREAAVDAWEELTDAERRGYWDRIDERIAFRPIMSPAF
jgi:hypothetical protein